MENPIKNADLGVPPWLRKPPYIYIYTYDPRDYFLDISCHTCGHFIYSIIYIYYPIIAMTHTTGIVWLPSGLLKRGERWTVPVAKKADLTAPRFITGAYYPIMIPMIIPYQLQWLWSIFLEVIKILPKSCIISAYMTEVMYIPYPHLFQYIYIYETIYVWLKYSMGIPHVTNWSHPCHRNFRAGILDECHAVFHVGTPSEWMICGGSCFWRQLLSDIFCWLVFLWCLNQRKDIWLKPFQTEQILKSWFVYGFPHPGKYFLDLRPVFRKPTVFSNQRMLHGLGMSNQSFHGFSNWWRSFTQAVRSQGISGTHSQRTVATEVRSDGRVHRAGRCESALFGRNIL